MTYRSLAVLAVTLLLTVSLPLLAQEQFKQCARDTLPHDLPRPVIAEIADMDGDGDPDLLYAGYDPATLRPILVLLRNDGSGTFGDPETTVLVPFAGGSVAFGDLATGDVDGDGDLDVVIARPALFAAGGQTMLWRNDGNGGFVETRTLPNDDALGSAGVAFLDADGDQDLDLFVCGSYTVLSHSPERLYLNDGTGTFVTSTRPMPQDGTSTTLPRAGDVDGDGDHDVIVVQGLSGFPLTGGAALYRNDGAGGFVEASGALPASVGNGATSSELFDADGDGDLDLALASPGGSPMTGRDRLLRNDGAGTFTDVSATHLPPGGGTTALSPLDVDGDGDQDLVAARVDAARPADWLAVPDRLYENDGAGRFTDASAARMPGVPTRAAAACVADLDGDGDSDVLLVEIARFALLRNEAGVLVDDVRQRVPADLDGSSTSSTSIWTAIRTCWLPAEPTRRCCSRRTTAMAASPCRRARRRPERRTSPSTPTVTKTSTRCS